MLGVAFLQDTIFKQGDTGQEFFVIRTGEASVFVRCSVLSCRAKQSFYMILWPLSRSLSLSLSCALSLSLSLYIHIHIYICLSLSLHTYPGIHTVRRFVFGLFWNTSYHMILHSLRDTFYALSYHAELFEVTDEAGVQKKVAGLKAGSCRHQWLMKW